jgi:2'-5' RNA ligase
MSELPRAEGLRLLADEALHVTLCFLGATPSSERYAIGAACREATAAHGPLRLSLGEPLALPRRRPRVVAVGVSAAADTGEREHRRDPGEIGGELDELQAALSARLAAGGWYRPEPRPFLAHLTVARARSQARIDARALARLAPIETPPFVADTVTVFRSHTRPGGARYEPLVRVLLAPGA